ncbi:neuropeptide Y receptor activity [Sparganum proliferum]
MTLVGNNIVIYVVIRCRSMWSITNFFVANLAISDVLMSMFAALFTPIAYYTDEWLLPHFLCRLLPFTMGVSVHVSTLTSTAIAVDRYLVIVHPFFPKMQRWMCFSIIAAIWCTSILICLPLAIFQHIEMESKQNNTVCAENWPSVEARKIFSISSFVFQFVIPCVVISFCYFHVSRLLWIRRNHKIGSGVRSAQKEEAENRRHRKMNTMLIAMVVVFVILAQQHGTDVVLFIGNIMTGKTDPPIQSLEAAFTRSPLA